ncbi:MAG: aldo/keto reductase [Rhodothermales bacterium]|nr:aldo/keto reductase [Rhodothermales bacterium]
MGTAQFGLPYGMGSGRQTPLQTVSRILRLAWESGVTQLDTAIAYGTAESALGEVGVRNWDVTTKLPELDLNRPLEGQVYRLIEGSLRRVRLDKFKCVLLHRPLQLMKPNGEQLYSALLKLRDDDICDSVGVSIYNPVELNLLSKKYPIGVVQGPLSVVDRRLADAGWTASCSTEFQARSVFLQGLLLRDSTARPPSFDRWAKELRPFDEWARGVGAGLAEACLGHVLSYPNVSRVVVGIESLEQLQSALRAASNPKRAPENIAIRDETFLDPRLWP